MPASEIATAASPAVLKKCIWISRDRPGLAGALRLGGALGLAHREPAGRPAPRRSPGRATGARPRASRPGSAASAARSVDESGLGVAHGPILPGRPSPDLTATGPMGHDCVRDHDRAPQVRLRHRGGGRPGPRRPPRGGRRRRRRRPPRPRRSRASGWSPTCSPASAPGYVGWRWSVTVARAPRAARTSPSTRSCWSPATRRSSPRRGCPTASGSSPATCRPATCSRSTTTTRGWSRRTPSATTRSTPTTRRRSARSPRTSASAGCARSSLEGRELAAQRWYDGDGGPEAPIAQLGPGPLHDLRLPGPHRRPALGDVRRLRQRRRQRRRPGRVVRPRLRRALRGAAGQEARAAAAAGAGLRHADHRRGRDRSRPELSRASRSAACSVAGAALAAPAVLEPEQAEPEAGQAGPQPPDAAGVLEPAVERQQGEERRPATAPCRPRRCGRRRRRAARRRRRSRCGCRSRAASAGSSSNSTAVTLVDAAAGRGMLRRREHPDHGRLGRPRPLLQDHRARLDGRPRGPRRPRHLLHDGLHHRAQPADPRVRAPTPTASSSAAADGPTSRRSRPVPRWSPA